jgi:cephalosporin hydroxylase
MNEVQKFKEAVKQNIVEQGSDEELLALGKTWVRETMNKKFIYNFTWMGRPIIQHPHDTMALQELIWQIKPDLIIETGIAHGGSIIFSASMLELLGGDGKVIAIDIDIRKHNRDEIEAHPMFKRIDLVEGSSIATETLDKVKELAKGRKNIMVILDSNHTHEHVTKELELYSPFVSVNSYLVVFDTWVEDVPENYYPDRPWDKGDNPKTAVWEFVEKNKDFVIDKSIEHKLVITLAPDGFLKRIQ